VYERFDRWRFKALFLGEEHAKTALHKSGEVADGLDVLLEGTGSDV
jgi:hypothetical protein